MKISLDCPFKYDLLAAFRNLSVFKKYVSKTVLKQQQRLSNMVFTNKTIQKPCKAANKFVRIFRKI